MSPSLRAMKSEQVQFSLRSSGNYRSDQGSIWDKIAEKAERRGAQSPSMSMGEIYDKDTRMLAELGNTVYEKISAERLDDITEKLEIKNLLVDTHGQARGTY